jgi:hypothetical protein
MLGSVWRDKGERADLHAAQGLAPARFKHCLWNQTHPYRPALSDDIMFIHSGLVYAYEGPMPADHCP